MAKRVPEMVKKARGRDVSPKEIGPPNAEPKGVWRILRNSVLLTVAVFGIVFTGYFIL